MTNDESRKKLEWRITNDEGQTVASFGLRHSDFVILSSFVIRHSSFLLEAGPVLLRQRQLLLIIALQICRLRHLTLVDGAVVVAERLAQGERRGARQGTVGHGADERDELDHLARRLTEENAHAERTRDLQ